jgi:hypothetical protein
MVTGCQFRRLLLALLALGAVPATVRSATAAPTAAKLDPCALLTPAEGAAIVGKAVTAKQTEGLPYATVCKWLLAGGQEAIKIFVTTNAQLQEYQKDPNENVARQYEQHKRGTEAKDRVDVKGIGDAAFWSKETNALLFFKTDKAYCGVQVNKKGGIGMSGADDLPAAKAAALKILAKL